MEIHKQVFLSIAIVWPKSQERLKAFFIKELSLIDKYTICVHYLSFLSKE